WHSRNTPPSARSAPRLPGLTYESSVRCGTSSGGVMVDKAASGDVCKVLVRCGQHRNYLFVAHVVLQLEAKVGLGPSVRSAMQNRFEDSIDSLLYALAAGGELSRHSAAGHGHGQLVAKKGQATRIRLATEKVAVRSRQEPVNGGAACLVVLG